MDIKQVKRSSYVCSKNDKNVKVEFSRVGRYDTFDGKYHPAWLVSYNGNLKVCTDKKSAFAFAIWLLSIEDTQEVMQDMCKTTLL